ncbi:hypothetical protein KAR91_04375 [Candidatus Pacearchaeota archaeon]|nr:hypothetical protein [Candidatus Pacearchaeota archaeon]
MLDETLSDSVDTEEITTESETVETSEVVEETTETTEESETTEQSEPEKGETTEESESSEGEEGDSKKVKKRIGKLKVKGYQQEQEIKRLKAELAEKSAQAEPAVKPTRPNELDYDDPAEFQAAQDKYDEDSFNHRMSERDKETAVQSSAESVQKQRQERVDNFDKKVAEVSEKIPDFEEVARSEDMLEIYNVAPHLADVIEESESGPEIAYFLGNNPEEAVRLAGLSTVQVAIEVGKLEGKLSNPLQKKNISKAAEPVNTLTGKGGEVIEKTVDDMTQKEYEVWRRKKK